MKLLYAARSEKPFLESLWMSIIASLVSYLMRNRSLRALVALLVTITLHDDIQYMQTSVNKTNISPNRKYFFILERAFQKLVYSLAIFLILVLSKYYLHKIH